jgi:hypothetical protein
MTISNDDILSLAYSEIFSAINGKISMEAQIDFGLYAPEIEAKLNAVMRPYLEKLRAKAIRQLAKAYGIDLGDLGIARFSNDER